MASVDDVGIDLDFGFEETSEVADCDSATNEVPVSEKEVSDEVPVSEKEVSDEVPVSEKQATNEVPVSEKQATNEVPVSEKEVSDEVPVPRPSGLPELVPDHQPEESSSDEDVDLTAPVGGKVIANGPEDDAEFDFELVKTDPKAEQPECAPNKEEEATVQGASASEVKEEEEVGVVGGGGEALSNSPEGDSTEVLDASNTIQWKAATEEWREVKDVQLESDEEEAEEVATSNTPAITSQEAFNFLKNTDNVLGMYGDNILTSVPRSGFQAFLHALFGPPRLKRHLVQERDVLFAMALHPYNAHSPKHFQMLVTAYKALTGTSLDCPKFGNHWDAIGFQGTDPGTDFRGTGMLGLLCLLHLSGGGERQQVCLSLYRLSQDIEQNFPLALMSINWTRLLLQTLREGCLNKALNATCSSRRLQLGQAFLEMHTALAFRFLTVWQREHKTIVDSGLVLRELEDALRRSPAGLLKEWFSHTEHGQKPAAGPGHEKNRKVPNRADRYAASGDASEQRGEGVAELSMLN